MKCKTCGQEYDILEVIKHREEEYMQWLADRVNDPNLKPLPWMRHKPATYGDLTKPPTDSETQRRVDAVNEARGVK